MIIEWKGDECELAAARSNCSVLMHMDFTFSVSVSSKFFTAMFDDHGVVTQIEGLRRHNTKYVEYVLVNADDDSAFFIYQYRIILDVEKQVNWKEARDICRSRNESLLSIPLNYYTQEVSAILAFLKQKLEVPLPHVTFIGLHTNKVSIYS